MAAITFGSVYGTHPLFHVSYVSSARILSLLFRFAYVCKHLQQQSLLLSQVRVAASNVLGLAGDLVSVISDLNCKSLKLMSSMKIDEDPIMTTNRVMTTNRASPNSSSEYVIIGQYKECYRRCVVIRNRNILQLHARAFQIELHPRPNIPLRNFLRCAQMMSFACEPLALHTFMKATSQVQLTFLQVGAILRFKLPCINKTFKTTMFSFAVWLRFKLPCLKNTFKTIIFSFIVWLYALVIH